MALGKQLPGSRRFRLMPFLDLARPGTFVTLATRTTRANCADVCQVAAQNQAAVHESDVKWSLRAAVCMPGAVLRRLCVRSTGDCTTGRRHPRQLRTLGLTALGWADPQTRGPLGELRKPTGTSMTVLTGF